MPYSQQLAQTSVRLLSSDPSSAAAGRSNLQPIGKLPVYSSEFMLTLLFPLLLAYPVAADLVCAQTVGSACFGRIRIHQLPTS